MDISKQEYLANEGVRGRYGIGSIVSRLIFFAM